MNAPTTEWGPNLWYTLFLIAMQLENGRSAQQLSMLWDILNKTPYMLPCDTCAAEAMEYMRRNPLVPWQDAAPGYFVQYVRAFYDSVRARVAAERLAEQHEQAPEVITSGAAPWGFSSVASSSAWVTGGSGVAQSSTQLPAVPAAAGGSAAAAQQQTPWGRKKCASCHGST